MRGNFFLDELPDSHTSGHDRQVGSQAAMPSKSSQDGKVVLNDVQEDFSCQIFHVLGHEPNGTGLGSMVDDMDHQTEESIDKILPGTRLPLQTTLEQIAVKFRQGHGGKPRTARKILKQVDLGLARAPNRAGLCLT